MKSNHARQANFILKQLADKLEGSGVALRVAPGTNLVHLYDTETKQVHGDARLPVTVGVSATWEDRKGILRLNTGVEDGSTQ